MSRATNALITVVTVVVTTVTAVLATGPAVSAQRPPDDQRVVTAGPSAARRPIETRWLSSGVVPAADAVTTRSAPASDVLSATAPAAGGSSPIPLDDLISNYGCMMIDPDPGEHLGVNCIDDGWLNLDGTVYVHTTVPASQHVRFSVSPPSGTESGMPSFTAYDFDSAPNYSSYEFTSKSFDIAPGQTFYLLAVAWDGAGNMAWRYGTATVPATADVVIDTVTILNDGDEGSLNQGEIKIRLGIVDGDEWSFPEEKYDDGDWFDPDADHTISDAGPTLTIWATAVEDDPGQCVIESNGGPTNDFQDGGGCHYAEAVETFDLTTGQPTLDVDFTSPHEHLRIRIEGRITVSLP